MPSTGSGFGAFWAEKSVEIFRAKSLETVVVRNNYVRSEIVKSIVNLFFVFAQSSP